MGAEHMVQLPWRRKADVANATESARPVSLLSDEELMDQYTAGNSAAFNELFRRFVPRLTRFLTPIVGESSAPDLVQLTFLKLHENRHRYRVGAKVSTWVFTIAKNAAYDVLRSAPRRREVFDEDAGKNVPQDAPMRDLWRDARLRAALDQLPQEQRDVLVLYWFGDLSFDEVASVIGITSPAARARAYRAYETLRQQLKGFHLELEREIAP